MEIAPVNRAVRQCLIMEFVQKPTLSVVEELSRPYKLTAQQMESLVQIKLFLVQPVRALAVAIGKKSRRKR
jgi:hypothetical protein